MTKQSVGDALTTLIHEGSRTVIVKYPGQVEGISTREFSDRLARHILGWMREELRLVIDYDDPLGPVALGNTFPAEPEIWYRDHDSVIRLDVEPHAFGGVQNVTNLRKLLMMRTIVDFAAKMVGQRASRIEEGA